MFKTADKLDGQILKGLLDTLVLNVLLKSDNYGFGILTRLKDEYGIETQLMKEATLYPLLHRLEANGFLHSYFRPGDRGTARKYYRLTDGGRKKLGERIDAWKRVKKVIVKIINEEEKNREAHR